MFIMISRPEQKQLGHNPLKNIKEKLISGAVRQ
jgi:hypothetical protein